VGDRPGGKLDIRVTEVIAGRDRERMRDGGREWGRNLTSLSFIGRSCVR
jgi:hypothetical protein